MYKIQAILCMYFTASLYSRSFHCMRCRYMSADRPPHLQYGPLPSSPPHFWRYLVPRFYSEATAHRLRVSHTIHCSKKYQSIAYSVTILFSTFYPQLCEKNVLQSPLEWEVHQATTRWRLSAQSTSTGVYSRVDPSFRRMARTYCSTTVREWWTNIDFNSMICKYMLPLSHDLQSTTSETC